MRLRTPKTSLGYFADLPLEILLDIISRLEHKDFVKGLLLSSKSMLMYLLYDVAVRAPNTDNSFSDPDAKIGHLIRYKSNLSPRMDRLIALGWYVISNFFSNTTPIVPLDVLSKINAIELYGWVPVSIEGRVFSLDKLSLVHFNYVHTALCKTNNRELHLQLCRTFHINCSFPPSCRLEKLVVSKFPGLTEFACTEPGNLKSVVLKHSERLVTVTGLQGISNVALIGLTVLNVLPDLSHCHTLILVQLTALVHLVVPPGVRNITVEKCCRLLSITEGKDLTTVRINKIHALSVTLSAQHVNRLTVSDIDVLHLNVDSTFDHIELSVIGGLQLSDAPTLAEYAIKKVCLSSIRLFDIDALGIFKNAREFSIINMAITKTLFMARAHTVYIKSCHCLFPSDLDDLSNVANLAVSSCKHLPTMMRSAPLALEK